MNKSTPIAWITGASSGIGENLVYEYVNSGYIVIISARRVSELERVKAHCSRPENVHIVPVDLTSDQSILQAAETVKKQFDGIDVLINNGGVSQRSLALETPFELDRHLFQVNYFGHVLLTKQVAPWMVARKKGTIVVISSLSGKWGFYLRSAYAASKHALHGFFESLRMEIENQGVQITLVTPGFIATDISKHAVDKSGKPTGEMDNNQAQGLAPSECARRIKVGVDAGKKEFGVGKKELLGLTLRRLFPNWFDQILRKQAAR
ncbi:MAG: SDR family oxidoreductase [Flavobacteriales bacterium]